MIDLKQELKTLENGDIKFSDAEGEEGTKLTLKSVFIRALTISLKDEGALSGEIMIKRYELAKKISLVDEIELVSEEKVMIKDLVGKFYGVLVYGRVNDVLEAKETPKLEPVNLEEAKK